MAKTYRAAIAGGLGAWLIMLPQLAWAAGSGGFDFDQLMEGRMLIMSAVGVGGTLTGGMIWFGIWHGRRQARRSVEQYQASLDEYRRKLHRSYKS